MRWKWLLPVLVLAGLPLGPALAQSDCEKIQSPFAYNECLARQAPSRAQRASRGRGQNNGGDPEASVRGRARGEAQPDAPTRGVSISRRSGRRVSATIDPWAGARSAGPTRKRRR